jgi:hypothetical protein
MGIEGGALEVKLGPGEKVCGKRFVVAWVIVIFRNGHTV